MVLLRSILAVFILQLFTVPVFAVVVDRATVGGDDTYLYLCPSAPPSDANEVACFGSAGASTTVPQITQLSNGFVELADDAGVYAMALPAGYHSSHFLLKTGNIGGADKQYSFIFTNNTETGYAVFNMPLFQTLLASLLPDTDFDNIGKISHITAFTTDLVTPLPAAVWMMLSALGGIFGFKRFSLRRRQAA